jgi:hypothetical protein
LDIFQLYSFHLIIPVSCYNVLNKVDMSIISIGAIAVFGLIQIFAVVMVVVVRYHFKLFSLPYDKRAKKLVNLITFGTIVLFLASGFLTFLNFN